MSEDREYGKIAGFIQFDPNDGETPNGTKVRNVVVDDIVTKKRIKLTIWPSHDNLSLDRNDFIAAEGKITIRNGQDKAGNERTYYNMSASRIVRVSEEGTTKPPEKKVEETTDETDPGF